MIYFLLCFDINADVLVTCTCNSRSNNVVMVVAVGVAVVLCFTSYSVNM